MKYIVSTEHTISLRMRKVKYIGDNGNKVIKNTAQNNSFSFVEREIDLLLLENLHTFCSLSSRLLHFFVALNLKGKKTKEEEQQTVSS